MRYSPTPSPTGHRHPRHPDRGPRRDPARAPASAATSATDAEALIIGWINRDRVCALVSSRCGPTATWAHRRPCAPAGWPRQQRHEPQRSAATWPSQLNDYDVSLVPLRRGRSATRRLAWTDGRGQAPLLRLEEQLAALGDADEHEVQLHRPGLAYRSSNRRTFGSAVLTESPDHTRPIARINRAVRSGDDLRWTWNGYDPRLQTHTAGLRDFDVQYRVGSGSWVTSRNDTTSKSVSTSANRVRRPDYSGIRVPRHRSAW